MAYRILVADDDPHIREVVCFALERAGMETDCVADGAAALERFTLKEPDLAVLDVGMPERDGLEVCREIRKTSAVPILFLSARDEEIDRILGLEMGGDDYVTKPFSPRELVARVNAILRRRQALPPEPLAPARRHGNLVLDGSRHSARVGSRELGLTSTEYAIVSRLLIQPGFVVSRSQLMSASHAANVHVSDRTMDSHIRNIRAKLAALGVADGVETVHGLGFRLGPCGA